MKFKLINLLLWLLISWQVKAQQVHSVTGIIKNADAQPVAGVSITVKGKGKNVISDNNGSFALAAVMPQDTLVISHINYETQEIPVGNEAVMKIKVTSLSHQLDQVVVVGYGRQKKANLTGSVASVDMDKTLGDRPVASTAQALQGAAPGLQVVTSTGRPGQSSSLNIRGYTSINGGSPLVLVDNAEVPSIDDINPRDIESISVLKDASSSAIYGARGAFGVILINTKKGKNNERMRVNYNSNFAFTKAADLPLKLNTYETGLTFQKWELESTPLIANVNKWVDLLNDYQSNPGTYPGGVYIDPTTGNRYPLADTYDYWGTAFQTGFEHLHNLSVSGGSANTSYRVSLGYTNQNGILITDKDSYRRYNVNSYFSVNLAKNLTASFNVFYKNDDRKTPQALASVFANGVLYPSFAPQGYYEDPATGDKIPYRSPDMVLNRERPYVDNGDDIRLYGRLEWKPLNKLTLASEYTVNRTNNYFTRINEVNLYIDGANNQPTETNNGISSFYKGNGNTTYQSINATARYDDKFGGHNLSVLGGVNYEDTRNQFFYSSRNDLISPDAPSISTASGDMFAGDSYFKWAVGGFFGRINYNYNEKYLLEVSARYDGSSRFAPEDRFVFVPSASAGWVLSKENFMKSLYPVLSNLKLFGSYGTIGNQNTGSNYYPYLSTMSTYAAEWINASTNLRYLTIGSPNLISAGFTWEQVRTMNLGVDFGFFKNRLAGTFEWYKRQTLGMLDAAVELPAILGTTAPLQNVTDLETKGWELNLKWTDRIGKVNYSLGGNLFDSRSFITGVKLETGGIYGLYKGKEIGELWGYNTIGFFNPEDFAQGVAGNINDVFTLNKGIAPYKNRSQIPGDLRFEDVNGDGIINSGNSTLDNPGDLKRIGNNQRRYQYGINGSVSYANFDLSFFLQGVGKRDRFIYTYLTFPYFSTFTYGVFQDQTDVWTADHQDAYFPRVASRNYDLAGQDQTRYLFDASYLNIRNITLGYNLPVSKLGWKGVSKLRIYLSGENLYTFDHLPRGVQSDLFIESAGAGYPSLKKFSFGIDVAF